MEMISFKFGVGDYVMWFSYEKKVSISGIVIDCLWDGISKSYHILFDKNEVDKSNVSKYILAEESELSIID